MRLGAQPAALRLHALTEAAPVLFLDNVNATNLRSDLLASVISEPNVDVRLLGVSRMVRLNPSAFVAVTGNGLRLSEDLTRRFITCERDAKTEDPKGRPFAPGFLDAIKARRLELLAAALTIWRWGRQCNADLAHGRLLEASNFGRDGFAIRSWRLAAPIQSSAYPDRRPAIRSERVSPPSSPSRSPATATGQ